MSRSLDGSMALDSEQPINEANVTRWIKERADAEGPLRFELIAQAGHLGQHTGNIRA